MTINTARTSGSPTESKFDKETIVRLRMNRKRVKGMIPRQREETGSYKDEVNKSPYLRALEDPDLLSDEAAAFKERDFDEEQIREEYLTKFKLALTKLTPKQRAIVDAMDRHQDQQKAANELGIARPTVAVTLMQIEKKIQKLINKMQNGQF